MEYKGKLYGHLGNRRYFDTGKTADDWDNLEKRIAELEAENQALLQADVSSAERKFCPFCKNEVSRMHINCQSCDAHLMPD
jgi:hypothetical protein